MTGMNAQPRIYSARQVFLGWSAEWSEGDSIMPSIWSLRLSAGGQWPAMAGLASIVLFCRSGGALPPSVEKSSQRRRSGHGHGHGHGRGRIFSFS